jgi:hypothetical protein
MFSDINGLLTGFLNETSTSLHGLFGKARAKTNDNIGTCFAGAQQGATSRETTAFAIEEMLRQPV